MKKATILLSATLLLSLFSKAQKHTPADIKKMPITIGVTDEIASVQLHENRKLNIYLPEGYNDQDSIKYNVIYLLDGSLDEDFLHIAGLVQFNAMPWVNRLPNSIIVGIANVDRKRDMTFPTTVKADKEKFPTTGHSADFIAFIEKELQPYIQKQYKTGSSKMLIGQSLGGLLATEILTKKPELFNSYIIISPSLWWNNGSLLKQPIATITQHTNIYIGVGKEGSMTGHEDQVMEQDAEKLAEKIRKEQGKNTTVYFDYLPDDNHATIMHQAVMNAFIKLAPANTKNK